MNFHQQSPGSGSKCKFAASLAQFVATALAEGRPALTGGGIFSPTGKRVVILRLSTRS